MQGAAAGPWSPPPQLSSPSCSPLCSFPLLPQRQGVCTLLLASLLEQWDAGRGGGLILTTQERGAEQLYARFGFELLKEVHLPSGYTNTYMHRPAAATPAGDEGQ